jgi:hypothetical protein
LKRPAGLAATALALGAAAIANAAGGGYTFDVVSQPVSDGFQSRAAVGCAEGDVAISGAVYTSGVYADGNYISESYPGVPASPDSAQGWTGSIDNYPGGSTSNTMYVQVICAKNAKGDYREIHVEDGLKVRDDSLKGRTLSCGRGQAVVGGGADTSLNAAIEFEFYMSMSMPVDGPDSDHAPNDAWRVEYNNDEDSSGKTSKADLYAICDKRRGPSAYRYPTQTTKVADGTQGAKSVGCKGNERLVGGGTGALAPYSASMLMNSLRFDNSGDSDYAQAYFDNYTTPDGKKREFSITSICR